MPHSVWFTSAVFLLTYLGLAVGGIPGLRTDRAGIALIGAALFLAFGSVSLDEAATSVNASTMVLLFGMMVVVVHLQLAGFFSFLTYGIARAKPSSHQLLVLVILLSGTLSAFLVNDIVCLALTPLILGVCIRLGKKPIPFLLALATASNFGSVATITGNPQNMIIGTYSGISYAHFAARLSPIACFGLLIDYAVIAILYRKDLSQRVVHEHPHVYKEPTLHVGLLIKTLLVTAVMLGFFFSGVSIAIVALAAASFLLLEKIRPDKVFEKVDWSLLVLFAGLFVVVHVFEHNVVSQWDITQWKWLTSPKVIWLSLASAGLSNLVSNVPAVLLFRPLISPMSHPVLAWLTLAMSSTVAGNLTLLGSVANLIVVEIARKEHLEITFWDYLKIGVPITLLTLGFGICWLTFVHY